MTRILLTVLASLAAASAQSVPPMPRDAKPTFEVATIKRTESGHSGQGFHSRGHRISIENQTLTSLVMFAYGVHSKQIVAAPDWFETERYDVDGVPDVEGEPNLIQYQGMVRSLLEDRFALKLHREKRELPIYAITVLKSGSRLTPSKAAPDSQPDQTGDGNAREQYMRFTNNTLDEFALGMQYFMSRPVVNQTGLPGRYDFTLRWGAEDAPPADTAAPPAIFTAIQEQLGLKLEPVRGSADVLVIEAVQRPSAN